MQKGIIFDMDGLMIDSERVTFEGYVQLCSELGKTLDEKTYLKCLGKPVQAIWQVFYDKFGNDFPAEEIMKKNHVRIARIFEEEGVPIKKGLKELLCWLKERGYSICLATSSNRNRVDRILELAGLNDYFDASVCGDEIRHGKPAPDIFLKASEKIGLAPEDCLVLEDSEMGIEAAYRAGMDVICIPDMKVPEEEYAGKCWKIEDSLLEVIDVLKERDQV